MVHYIINPWRSRQELLEIRRELYPAPNTSTQDIEQGRQHAVALVSVWEQRGNCPHLVASTALLTAAILNDVPQISAFCVRAAYSAAFSRFVTGLLDGYQDKKHKQSMYSIAKSIGLPATFVELRHQAAHEDLPSLKKLRNAAQRAMQWIWDFYWKDLSPLLDTYNDKLNSKEGESESNSSDMDEMMGIQICDLDALKEELRLEKELASESEAQSLINDESPIRDIESLKREMMMIEEDIESVDDENIQSEKEDRRGEVLLENKGVFQNNAAAHSSIGSSNLQSNADESDEESGGCGWEPWVGPWVPRPIGVAG